MLGSAPPSSSGESGLEGFSGFAKSPSGDAPPAVSPGGTDAPPGAPAVSTGRRSATAPGMPRAFYTTGRDKGGSPMLLYAIAGVLGLVVLAAAVHFLFSGDAPDQTADNEVDETRARTYIASLVMGVKPLNGADEHYKAGRAAYLEDSALGYRKAASEFIKAVARDPDHGLALAGMVEAEVNDPAGRPDVERLQILFELADHAVRLAPEEAATHRARASLLNAVDKKEPARLAGMQAKKLSAPKCAEALLVLGETYVADSPEVGIDYLEEARQTDPELKRAVTVLADAYRRAGRTSEALKLLESRLAKDSGHVASLVASADLLAANGMFDRARARYLEALDAGHGSERAHIGLGILLYQGFGEHKAARRHLTKALEAAEQGEALPPEVGRRLHTHLGILEREAGKLDSAEEQALLALDIDPQYPPALFLMGDLYLRAGKVIDAKKKLDALLEELPEFAPAIRKAGRVAEDMPDLERAVKLFNRAVHNDRYSVGGFVALAGLYARLQNNDRVYGVIHKSLQLPPDVGDGPAELTDFYEERGDLDRAVKALRGLVEEQPEQPAAHTALGIGLHWTGRYRESTQSLQRALSLDANDFGARLYLAANLLRRRNVGAAEKEIRRALAIERLNLAAGYVAGRVAEAKKDWKQAMRRYEEVLDVDPAYLPVNLRLGLVKLRLGNKAEAQQMLRQVLVVQPANLLARRALFRAQ